MRNLKRALSLALASVMLMGMMVVGASAASYPDVDADKHDIEAIDVLEAIGLMQGDKGTGNFRPDDKVTRNEMAVVMAKLILGTYEADSYTGVHPFTDVPSWADKYVAACYAAGIINGTSETTYSGTSNVTAVQAAAMMLRALGYEDLSKNAAKWDVPVAAKANEINLFKGMTGNGAAQLTRNEIAKLTLNTLQADVVTTEREGGVEVPGVVTIPAKITYKVVESKDGYARAIDNTEGTYSGGYVVQLGEKLYKGDLVKADTTDDFNRPATEWLYKSNSIDQYADEADATYTEEVKISDIYKDLGLSKEVEKDDVTFTMDGVVEAVDPNTGIQANDNTYLNAVKLTRNGADKDVKIGGNGVLVQAYKETDTDTVGGKLVTTTTVDITIVNTYVLQVDGDYNDKKEELRLKELDGAAALPGSTSTTLSSDDFSGLDAFKDEDYVLVTVADEEIKTIEAAEALTETVTAYVAKKGDANSSNVTAGSTYKYDKNYTAADKTYEIGEDYLLVLDNYGYVIFTDGVDVDDQYVYVVDNDLQGGVKSDMEADAYFTDGTNEVIIVKKHDSGALSAGNDAKHMWFTYEKKSGNKYELTELKAKETAGDNTTAATSGTVIADTNRATVIYATGKSFRANNDTTFIVLRDGTVYVYNGIKNVPKIEAAGSGAYVNAVMDGSFAKYVFIEATAKADLDIGSAKDNYIYIYDEEPTKENNKDGDPIYIYKVIQDGELTTLTMSGKTDGTNNWTLGLYSDLKTDSDGYVDEATRVVNSSDPDLRAYMLDGTTKVDISGDVLSIGSVDLVMSKDGVKIWVSDGDDTTTINNSRFTRDYKNLEGVLFVVLDDDIVQEIYVEEDEDIASDASITPDPESAVNPQPESKEDLKEDLDKADNAEEFEGVEEIVTTGLTQSVSTTGGTTTITVTGTVKGYDKNNMTADIKKALEIWWFGNNEDGTCKGSFTDAEAAITGVGFTGASDTIGIFSVNIKGETIMLIVKNDGTGKAVRKNNSNNWAAGALETGYAVDISGLKIAK